jgi:hypothetical protein
MILVDEVVQLALQLKFFPQAEKLSVVVSCAGGNLFNL